MLQETMWMKHLNYACGPIPQKSLQASCIGPGGANGRIGHSQEKQPAPNTNINKIMVIFAGVCARKINMEPEHGDFQKTNLFFSYLPVPY